MFSHTSLAQIWKKKNSEQDFPSTAFLFIVLAFFFFYFLTQMSKVLQPYVSVLPAHSVPFTFTVHFLLSNVQAALLFLASEHIT